MFYYEFLQKIVWGPIKVKRLNKPSKLLIMFDFVVKGRYYLWTEPAYIQYMYMNKGGGCIQGLAMIIKQLSSQCRIHVIFKSRIFIFIIKTKQYLIKSALTKRQKEKLMKVWAFHTVNNLISIFTHLRTIRRRYFDPKCLIIIA